MLRTLPIDISFIDKDDRLSAYLSAWGISVTSETLHLYLSSNVNEIEPSGFADDDASRNPHPVVCGDVAPDEPPTKDEVAEEGSPCRFP